MLFVDEAYSLARTSAKNETDSYGQEAIDTLLNRWKQIMISWSSLSAGHKEPMEEFLSSNPGPALQFTRYLTSLDYSPKELLLILSSFAKRWVSPLPSRADTRECSFSRSVFRKSDTPGMLVSARIYRTCDVSPSGPSRQIQTSHERTSHDFKIVDLDYCSRIPQLGLLR